MRRAQFEIMGLAIVVVIATIGIFFLLSFSIGNEDPQDSTDQFTDEQFTQNVIDALMKTSMEGCETYTIADIIYYHVTGRGEPGSPRPGTRCAEAVDEGQIGSFSELEERMKFIEEDILEETMNDFRGTPYHFQLRSPECEETDVYGQDCDTVSYSSQGCDPRVQRTSRPGKQSVRLYPRPDGIQVVLWTCSPRRA